MINEDLAVQIEQDILKRLDRIKTEKGMTDIQWGDAAFAGDRSGRRKVQNLKHMGIRLRVGDFVRLCKALDEEPTRILGNALDSNNL